MGRDFWNADIYATPPAKALRSLQQITDPYTDCPIDITFFVSCYNESAHIITTLDMVLAAAQEVGVTYEIIVIDDGSRDNSVALVKQYIETHPDENVLLRVNAKNKGLAQNYFDAAYIGRGKYYRLICGDNSEPKETIVSILRLIGEADMIVPYHISSEGKGAYRQFISKAYTSIINFCSGHRLQYYNGLAVHLRFNVIRWHSNTRGFGFQADLLCILLDLGFTYKEIGVAMIEMRQDKSNAITLRNLLSVIHTIVEIAIRRVSNWVYGSRG